MTPHPAIMPLGALLLAGCATIHPEFDATRAAALADSGPAPVGWKPDAVLRLSSSMLDAVVEEILVEHGTLSETLNVAGVVVKPRLEVTALTLRGGQDCDDCVALSAELEGRLRWSTPLGKGRTVMTASTDLDGVFTAMQDDGVWTLTAQPRSVRNVTIRLGESTVIPGLHAALRPWIDEALTDIEPTPIATLGSGDLPLRAVRVVPDRRTIQLQLLTDANQPSAVSVVGPRPKDGFAVYLHPEALVAMARTASFRAGPVAMDVTPEPRSLEVDGDHFTLVIRLWRTNGRGWWRDVQIEGTLDIRGGDLHLQPDSVVELAQSRGAVFVDPLAALAEGVIWRTLEEALHTSVPASTPHNVAGLRTEVVLTHVEGREGRLFAEGELYFGGDVPPTEQTGSGRGGGTVQQDGRDEWRLR